MYVDSMLESVAFTLRLCFCSHFHFSQLSKGINGVTFAAYDILQTTPSTSVAQEQHCVKVASPALSRGLRQFKRLQSAETAYADAYAKMNLGVGPFAKKE